MDGGVKEGGDEKKERKGWYVKSKTTERERQKMHKGRERMQINVMGGRCVSEEGLRRCWCWCLGWVGGWVGLF